MGVKYSAQHPRMIFALLHIINFTREMSISGRIQQLVVFSPFIFWDLVQIPTMFSKYFVIIVN